MKTKIGPARATLDSRRVRIARLSAGFDRAEDVAKRLGVKRATYAHWELGTYRIPPRSLAKLARLLGVAESKLLA